MTVTSTSAVAARSPLHEDELSRIDRGESYLKSLGFPAVRLRSHGDIARIEVPQSALTDVLAADADGGIHITLKNMGYMDVVLDKATVRAA